MGIIIMMVIPVVMTALFGFVFGENARKDVKIKVLVEDRDGSFFSQFLTRSFETPQVKKFINPVIVKKGEGEGLIKEGDASALLIIPPKFSYNLVHKKKNELIVVKNPSEQFFPQVIEDLTEMAAKLLSAFSQVFHDEIVTFSELFSKKKGNSENIIPDKVLAGSYKKIEKIGKYLSPLLVSVKTAKISEKKEENSFNIFSMLLPPISIMFLMFIIEMFLRDILSEKEDGTMQRILFSPVKPSLYIISKIMSGWIMGIFIYFIIVIVGIMFFGIDWGNYIYLSILVVITSFSIASFFAFLNSLFRDKNQAATVAAPVILVISAIGGSMIPYEMLPSFIKKISIFSINFWFMDGSNRILKSEFPGKNILIIGILGAVLFILSFKILVRRISR